MLNYFLKIRFLKYYFYKETVLRELHSLTTYEKREAYIETLDKSKYEVKAVDCSNVEEKTEWGGTSIKAGYFALIEDYNTEEKPDIENW